MSFTSLVAAIEASMELSRRYRGSEADFFKLVVVVAVIGHAFLDRIDLQFPCFFDLEILAEGNTTEVDHSP